MLSLILRLLKGRDDNLTDEELLDAFARSGDNRHVGVLYQRYTHLVLGVCMKYLKNEEAAADAAMEVFERLLTVLHQHKIDNFKAWLHTLVKNHCLMKLRKAKSLMGKEQLFRKFAIEFMEPAEEMHHNNEHETEQLYGRLQQALMQLKEEQRQCIQMFYLEERSYKEIVEMTGLDDKQVKSHLQNGKRNLKIYLTGKE
jgi:RNA polymerase sigma-70 factor (ECF subfamily)